MRFVAIKSAEQQALLVVHRVRKGLSDERTALINQLRGLLSEFGIVIAKGRYQARRQLPVALADTLNFISGRSPFCDFCAFCDICSIICFISSNVMTEYVFF